MNANRKEGISTTDFAEGADEGWNPMDTAPRDGTHILARWAGNTVIAYRVAFGWKTFPNGGDPDPTGWLPLPGSKGSAIQTITLNVTEADRALFARWTACINDDARLEGQKVSMEDMLVKTLQMAIEDDAPFQKWDLLNPAPALQ